MLSRILRARGVIPVALILAALAYWKLHPSVPKTIEVGYIGDRSVTLWNTLAQVRQPSGELHYGDRVEVIREEGTSAQIRTATGATGWLMDTRQLLNSDFWAQSAALLEKARTMPVQASGRTKTVSNVRAEPGRDGKRIFQLQRGAYVVVLARTVADIPPPNEESGGNAKPSGPADDDKDQKKEDWLLILTAPDPGLSVPITASDGNAAPIPRASGDPVSGAPRGASNAGVALAGPQPGQIAGWVLARFIEPNLPGPVKDYASSADLRVVAWFELNRVPDGSGGEAPQYLVAGSRGGEGQSCDFNMLRVYTWGAKRQRYETAYVESDLCGRLPIRVSQGPGGPLFEFPDADNDNAERKYAMLQTSVRHVKDPSTESAVGRRPPKKKP